LLIVNADIAGRKCAVRFHETIEAVGQLQPSDGEAVYDAQGGRLLPGLHDHHIHLRAMAARRASLDLSKADMGAVQDLAEEIDGSGWIRAFGYHNDRHGELNRDVLDELCPARPIRVQHSSGKMWVLNSQAIAILGVTAKSHAGVEVEHGRVTGRLFRMDDWLGQRQRNETVDLEPLTEELLRLGITSVTDTSFNNDRASEAQLKNLKGPNGQSFEVHCMGDESLVGGGQLKVMLDEDRLPEREILRRKVAAAHMADRGVAFHCVSRIEMLIAMDCLKTTGLHGADRIEHGAMIGVEMIPDLASLGVPVVTQPGFLRDRGERFRREVSPSEIGDLYRYQSLLQAGIGVVCSSDAPYGPVNPGVCVQAAATRLSDEEQPINVVEAVTAETARLSYLLDPSLGRMRRVEVGAVANLCLFSDGSPTQRAPLEVWLAGHAIVRPA
jgi:predicted amidohydrolase YtcJ